MSNDKQTKVRIALERAALFWKIIGDAGVPTSLGMKIGSAKFEALGDDEKFLLAKVAFDLVKADEKIKATIAQEAQAKAAIEAAAAQVKEEPPEEIEKPQEEPETKAQPTAYHGARYEDNAQEVTEAAPIFEVRKAQKTG